MSRRVLALLAGPFVLCLPGLARASNVTETPDNGSEQMARGGAWVARASDPLATSFNPAGLAGQPTRLTLQSSFLVQQTCMTRLKAAGDTTFTTPNGSSTDPLVDAGGHYPRVCNDIEANVNPQLGATFALTDRLGLGLLLIAPSSAGNKTFPEFVEDGGGQLQASPTRYLLSKQSGLILFPTIGIGYEPIDNLRIGASMAWGFAHIKNSAATVALNSNNTTADNDVRANLQVRDYFVPRFSLGAIYSLTPELDIAGWYQWTDAIRARGDVGTAANYYTRANARGDESSVRYGDSIFEDCGTGRAADAGKCGGGENGTLKIPIPMEAKIGARYHKPRVRPLGEDGNPLPPRHKRDPIANDVFDVELDLTWANNSAINALEIRFPGDATGRGLLPVAGVDGGEVPPNADQTRNYKDVFGVRFGGDYVVLPDRLSLRGGVFYETSALNPQYQGIDFIPSARFGLAGGASYRIKTTDTGGALEIMLGFGHVFFADQTREDRNASGSLGLAGTSCNGSDAASPETCQDGSARYRTKWPVNLGTITSSLNVINVGLAYRF